MEVLGRGVVSYERDTPVPREAARAGSRDEPAEVAGAVRRRRDEGRHPAREPRCPPVRFYAGAYGAAVDVRFNLHTSIN
jgi:hypothetical protein